MQILPRAVHRIILFLCPPQWDGSATTTETCLECLFDLVLKGGIYLPQRGWKEQDDTLQRMLSQFLRQKTADGTTQARIQFKLLMQWMRMRKVMALLFVPQKKLGMGMKETVWNRFQACICWTKIYSDRGVPR